MNGPKQLFICTVQSAPENGEFEAILRDATDLQQIDDVAVIRVEHVPEEDRHLILPGRLFDLAIEAQGRWRITFRRPTPISEGELQAAKEWARRMLEDLSRGAEDEDGAP